MKMCVAEPNFFEKILFWQKILKNGPKMVFFGLFRIIYSLVLSGNGVE